MSDVAAPTPQQVIEKPMNKAAIAVAVAALVVGALALAYVPIGERTDGPQRAIYFLLGAGFGAALLYGAFGFTAGWRTVVTTGDGRNLRAQFVVISLTMLAFIPLTSGWLDTGQTMRGLVFPVGVPVVIGSFIFGIGMQLGNGCGSGTLFTFGGGSKRMLFTLPAFIAGSVIGALHAPFWNAMPSIGSVNLARELTVPGVIVLQIGILAAIGWWTLRRERALGLKHSTKASPKGWWLRGPWPIYLAGIVIVILNIATLLISGGPWSITYGFAIWGGAILETVGVDVASWNYLGWAREPGQVTQAVVTSRISLMDLGLIFGAMLAAGLGGKFAAPQKLGTGPILAAIIGGLIMGYGARLSFGCNIGAYYAGIASGSLHGWVWFVCAFAGSLVGIRLRPLFGMAR